MSGCLRSVLIAAVCVAVLGFCANQAHQQKLAQIEDMVADARADAIDDAETDFADEAQEEAKEQLQDTTYVDQIGTSGCTISCEGHNAGYLFAIDNNYTDASECDRNSVSFVNGCEAYVTELYNLTAELLETKKLEASDRAEQAIRENS